MTLFSKKITLKGVGNALLSALVLLAVSCTQVDDNLGTNIVPPSQKFEVEFATLDSDITGYLTYTDSISTGNFDYAYFGKMTDKNYGARTTASSLVQFAYFVHSDTIAHEDRDAVPDSIAIVLGMKTVGGDTTKVQNFDVYRVRKMLERKTTYYNGTDIREYIDEQPIFTCSYSGKPNGSTAFDTLALRPTDAGREFIEELWSVDTELYSNDTLFMKQFNGLCITPSGTSPEDAAVYGMNLQWDTSNGPQSYLVLYGHDYPKGDDPSLVEDRIVRAFSITNSTTYSRQRAVTAVSHDYSAMEGGDAINYDVAADAPLENPTTRGYVQGFMGVATTLEFGDGFVESLRALCPEGGSIFINQATMYVDLASKDYTLYDVAPERLGTYDNYAKLRSVADYNYVYEQTYETELAYGGYLNRTFGYYSMDLSLYLQELLHDESGEVSRRITLGMDAYDYLEDAMVALDLSGSELPVKLDITYTIIGK